MSKTAESVMRDLPALAPAELERVRDEASRLLAQQAPVKGRDGTSSAPGRLIRPPPPEGHPGGSLERDDPFFEILQRIEQERHQRTPRTPIQFEL